MKVSLNTVKQYINVDLPPVDELVARINQQLGGVEDVVNLGAKYKDATIVKVVDCDKHPNADKLSVCMIDAGTGELITVVCGADNVKADMWAVWLPPESTVPSSYDEAEPFVLGARELRGVMSNGMLASARELALGDDHDGIVELTDKDLPEAKELETGASFAQTFGLDDTIIEIENKMFTHRPDLFGQLGVAREISAILLGISNELSENSSFINPDWYWRLPEFDRGSDRLSLEVFNDAPEGAPRFMAVAIDGVTVEPSPLWLRCELVRWGSKPINNIVDWTNYIMLLTAQPTHAYDYDKLRANKLGVRMAREGEKTRLLNGKQYSLTPDDIVIADGEGVIGLAGVMGGSDSEVSADTKRIVLEVANFDMYAVRKTSMRHGLFTDALTRFNKGQSPLQTSHIVKRLLELMPGQQASQVYDLAAEADKVDQASVYGEVAVSVNFINQRLGLSLNQRQIMSLLQRVNMSVQLDEGENGLTVTAPYWRTDIELPEDIVEEVGRLYGFDKLPRELPSRSMKAAPKSLTHEVKQSVRDSLARSGANEVLTYSFVHENIIKKSEQDLSQAFKLSNALSPDLQYYRLSVLPSLLDKVHMNIKAGHDEFVLFEIGKGHNKKYHLNDDEGLPSEMNFVDAVYASKTDRSGAAYYQIQRTVEQLANDLGFELVYKSIDEPMDYPVTAPFDQERSALVETTNGVFIGMIGELKQAVIAKFKLPSYSAAATLDLKGISQAIQHTGQNYHPLSKYPSVTQDLSLKVAQETSYASVKEAVESALKEKAESLFTRLKPLAIYQPDDATTKTITFRIEVASFDKTLTDSDVKPLLDYAAERAAQAVDAVVS